MAILSMRLTPKDWSSSTCSGDEGSGPRNRKFGSIHDTVKLGKGSSVVGGWSRSGLAVAGDEIGPMGVVGEWGYDGGEARFGEREPLELLVLGGDKLDGLLLDCGKVR